MDSKEILQKQLAEAEKLATLGQLTSAIAHDLNNNLDIILTKLFLLQKRLSEDNQNQDCWDHLVMMKRQLFRLTNFAQDILHYVKPRSTVLDWVLNVILLMHR